MSTALATTDREFDAPAVFGSRQEIKAITDRMRVMLPNARLADWQMNQALEKRKQAEDSLQSSLFRAAQLSVYYRLMPGKDIHIIPFGNDFAVDVGIEAWQKAADRYCRMMGITYHIAVEPMPADELKERRGKDLHAEDRGAIAHVWRSDKAQVYELLGKAAMTRGYGVWRKHARQTKKGWQSDPVQEHRTPQDVADRRAMKMALTREFSLDALLAATPAEERANLEKLENGIEMQRRDALPIADHPITRDDDGLLIWGEDDPDDGHYRHVDEDTGEILEEVIDDEPACPESAEGFPTASTKVEEREAVKPDIDYAGVVGSLGENCRKFANWCRVKHLNSDGPCTPPQYGLLQGTINDLTGEKGSHYAILHVLIGRSVDSKNPPGFDLVSALLDWLIEETGPKNAKVKNPNYKEEYAQCILSIHRAVREALGQLELPLAA